MQRQLEAARQECAELRKRAEEERVNADTWREAHQRLQMQLDEVNIQLISATKRLDDLTCQLFSGQASIYPAFNAFCGRSLLG